MKRDGIFIVLIIIFLQLNSRLLLSAVIFPSENNSNTLTDEITLELQQNPSGKLTPLYIKKLLELAPAVGRKKISSAFRETADKLSSDPEKSDNKKLTGQIINLAYNELNSSNINNRTNFSIIKKWNISGPWRRYGMPDIDYEFNPEKVFKIENIEKGKNLSTEENGEIIFNKKNNETDETVYATCSLLSESGIILWIISDAEYKLMINGSEIFRNKTSGKRVTNSFSLSGTGRYTIQIKLLSGDGTANRFIQGLVTDANHNPVKLSYSGIIYSSNFSSEKLFGSEETGEPLPHQASVLTSKVKKLIDTGNYAEAYKLGLSVIEKYPSYSGIYNEYIPLLDKMNRESEFHQAMENFLKIFPDSYVHYTWLAEFYMTRDKDKFAGIIKNISSGDLTEKYAKEYLYYLIGEQKYFEALALCSSLKGIPFFRRVIPEIIRLSGDNTGWRKSLIEAASVLDDAGLYYELGLAEMQSGLDPVMYWEKSSSMNGDPGLMRDLSDIYENGIIGVNDFYTGKYTDYHPEFGWNGKKRRVSIHIFESGRVLIEGEDIIPSGKKLKKQKYAHDGSGFSSGEIRTDIPYINGIKILYVLTAKDGLPVSVNFESELRDQNRLSVKYKSNGNEEYSVIRYSGEYNSDDRDVFTIVNGLLLKTSNEKISWLDYEVICHGNFTPHVRYNKDIISPGRYSDGVIRYAVKDDFSDDSVEIAESVILKFSSDKTFIDWYREVLNYTGKYDFADKTDSRRVENLEKNIRMIHLYVCTAIVKSGEINFNPGEMNVLLSKGEGTVEERTYLAKAVMESRGIKSYIAFRKNKSGLIDKILLYVPESRDKGYWLDFYSESISDKMESGYNAIVITGDGYNMIPVTSETYIR